MAQENPYAKYLQPAAPQASADPIVKPADPYKANAEARAQSGEARAAQDQALQLQKFQLDQEKAARDRDPQQSAIEAERKAAAFLIRALGSNESYEKLDIGPRSMVGQVLADSVPNALNSLPGAIGNSPDRQVADTNQDEFIAASLRQDSGAAIPEEEMARQRRIYFPMPGDGPEVIEAKRKARLRAIEGLRQSAGRLEPSAEQRYLAMLNGETAKAPPAVVPAGFDPGPQQAKLNESGFRQEDDPALVQAGVKDAFAAMLAQSVAPGPAIKKLRELGVTDPIVLRDAAAQLAFRQKNPDVPLDKYSYPAIDDRAAPLSGFEKAATAIGGNPVGAAIIGAGQMLSANTLDNLQADPERARAALQIVERDNPTAYTVGEVAGGVMGALSGEAALARAGMAPGLARGMVADTAYGAAQGAGAADNGSRVGGALQGGTAALAGNVAGNALTAGVGRIVGPTGSNMNALYEAGVRPTLGQRVVDKGVIGRAVNATEEALQSVPILGSAVSGARQEARDQFQIGAFNEALKEVGEQLPKGMKPGTAPNAYAQKTFDRIYAEARTGMVMRGDDELVADMDALDQQIATLAEPSAKRFNAIFKNVVERRAKNGGGEIAGKEYKSMVSDLGKQIRAIRSNPSGDMELASALQDLQGTLENAARRHSDPDAVALLDKADAGYAKLVRIEDAASRAGGDAGTFTPNQFDKAVQKQEGGVRSKAYLRGDALMQDYADQGRNLMDRVPNSGTPERTMIAAGLAGGATYVNPVFGSFLALIGSAYAPGVRKGMQAALKPAGPTRRAIADQLKKISRTAGAVGASTAVALPGTSPGQ